jgi:uncharacterized protein (TIGR00251 family)
MIAVAAHAEGCVVPVRAQPGAKRTGLVGEQAGSLKVAVTAPAVEGKANRALAEALREILGLKRSQVELIGGQAARDKRFLVRGVGPAEMAARLAVLLGDG